MNSRPYAPKAPMFLVLAPIPQARFRLWISTIRCVLPYHLRVVEEGAQMATFDVSHPDVFDFVKAKREDGRLRQFNLSLLITEEFIEAVRNDGSWNLILSSERKEVDEGLNLDGDDIVWKPFPTTEGYVTNDHGLVACRIYETIRAQKLWNAIMSSTTETLQSQALSLLIKLTKTITTGSVKIFELLTPVVSSRFRPMEAAYWAQ